MNDEWTHYIGIFDTRLVYKFIIMNGEKKTGQVVKGTMLKTDGVPIVVAIREEVSSKLTFIPWTAIASYELVLEVR